MSTLLLYGLYVFVFVSLGIDAIRKWPHDSRPRFLRAAWMVYYGIMLVFSGGAFLYLISYPADIQPITAIYPTWQVWVLYVLIALYFLVILIRLGEIARNLLHRFARQR